MFIFKYIEKLSILNREYSNCNTNCESYFPNKKMNFDFSKLKFQFTQLRITDNVQLLSSV